MSTASFDVSNVSRASGTDRPLGPAAYRDEDFPGCESFHLPVSALEHYEGRLEFWDGDTETAWKVCEPTSIYHEQPARRLGRMAERVASLRGSAIETFGSADLLRVDASGRKRWLMQADEVLYLHPDRVRLQGPAIEVDADPLPDVVLEVDHTTDVRRRKLGIYKASGFRRCGCWCRGSRRCARRGSRFTCVGARCIGRRRRAGRFRGGVRRRYSAR